MKKYCATSCDTPEKKCHKSFKICSQPHLYLRTKIYYCREETFRINGKRKFLRFSLHTTSYYEAREMVNNIKDMVANFEELKTLYTQLSCRCKFIQNNNPETSTLEPIYILDENSDKELLKKLHLTYTKCHAIPLDRYIKDAQERMDVLDDLVKLKPDSIEYLEEIREARKTKENVKKYISDLHEYKETYQKVDALILQVQELLSSTHNKQLASIHNEQNTQYADNDALSVQNVSVVQSSAIPHHTIQEVIERMKIDKKDKANNETFGRKVKKIEKLLSMMRLTFDDDYSRLNNEKTINQIEEKILILPKLTAKTRNAWILSVNDLITSANKLEPDYYKIFKIERRSENSTVAQKKKKEYIRFTEDDLRKIFNPDDDFFVRNPEIFWACLIGLYCGGRTNGITTLRYSDIIKDPDTNIDCFDFKLDDVEDDDDENPNPNNIKKLKNAASIRSVSIHSKLIKLGFLDFIRHYEERNKLNFQNFIFKRTLSTTRVTKEKTYNTHFMRPFFDQLKKIGIRKETDTKNNRWKSFHSMRKTLSYQLAKCLVPDIFVHRIVGWAPVGVREECYLQLDMSDIKHELEKLEYPCIDDALDKIAQKIRDKYNF